MCLRRQHQSDRDLLPNDNAITGSGGGSRIMPISIASIPVILFYIRPGHDKFGMIRRAISKYATGKQRKDM
jgi:hypothetical protein